MILIGIWVVCLALFAFIVWKWGRHYSGRVALLGAVFITPMFGHISGVDGIFAIYPMVVSLGSSLWSALEPSSSVVTQPGWAVAMKAAMLINYGLFPYLLVAGFTYGVIEHRTRSEPQ